MTTIMLQLQILAASATPPLQVAGETGVPAAPNSGVAVVNAASGSVIERLYGAPLGNFAIPWSTGPGLG